ncbi:MAG: hypothetical protein ACRYFX_05835 [Janthinobacterium lividum]
MATKKKDAPIGFGRKPMPTEAGDEFEDEQPAQRQVPPPLVEPIAVDDVEMYEILQRYNLQPLVPLAKFEYQLVEVIAALEKRVRELDPDL